MTVNTMKYLFVNIMLWLLPLSHIWAKNLEDFNKSNQELIINFKRLALSPEASSRRQASTLLNETEDKINRGEISGLQAIDLFTTYYLSSYTGELQRESVLSEFCLFQKYSDSSTYENFYKTLIDKLPHSADFYRDAQGETLLVKVVKQPRYSENSAPWIKKNTSCEEWLLEKGADPLALIHKPYDYNAFDVALVNHNKLAVELFKDWLAKHPQTLPWHTAEFLRAYNGEVFKTKDLVGTHRYRLYRVANQAGNFPLVKKLYEENRSFRNHPQEYLENWQQDKRVVNQSKDSYFYPPLWAYNIVQLRDYARQAIEKLQPYVINASDLEPVEGRPGLFNYSYQNKKIVLMKKDRSPIVGRVLGALHLKEVGSSYNVPLKFLVPPPGGLENAKVVFSIPELSDGGRHQDPMYTWGFITNRGLASFVSRNAVGMEIPGTELFVEHIEGQHVMGTPDYTNGFVDAKTNVIRRESDGKLFIIDTGDDKNFMVPVGDSFKAYEAKILHFAPQIGTVTIDLAQDHLIQSSSEM
jgi:hypothetical protein